MGHLTGMWVVVGTSTTHMVPQKAAHALYSLNIASA